MVVSGYFTFNNINFVEVNDPAPVNAGSFRLYTYDYFLNAKGHHAFMDTHHDITYVGGN